MMQQNLVHLLCFIVMLSNEQKYKTFLFSFDCAIMLQGEVFCGVCYSQARLAPFIDQTKTAAFIRPVVILKE